MKSKIIIVPYFKVKKYSHSAVLEHVDNKLPGMFINVQGSYCLLDDIRDILSLRDNQIVDKWLNATEKEEFILKLIWDRDTDFRVRRN